jgi:hypothetical protein
MDCWTFSHSRKERSELLAMRERERLSLELPRGKYEDDVSM